MRSIVCIIHTVPRDAASTPSRCGRGRTVVCRTPLCVFCESPHLSYVHYYLCPVVFLFIDHVTATYCLFYNYALLCVFLGMLLLGGNISDAFLLVVFNIDVSPQVIGKSREI